MYVQKTSLYMGNCEIYQLKHLTVQHSGCMCVDIGTIFPKEHAHLHMYVRLPSTALGRVCTYYGDTILVDMQ